MKIVYDLPPNYKEIVKVFDLTGKNPVFTYGDIIYYPFGKGNKIPLHLIMHESTHKDQQGNDPKKWWDEYLRSPEFRLNQELEAYRNQFQFYKNKNKSWMPFLKSIARDISSPMYGNMVSYNEALDYILNQNL